MWAPMAISHSPLPLEGMLTVVPSSLNSYAETERGDTCHQLSRHKGQGMKQLDARDKGKREALSPAAMAHKSKDPSPQPPKEAQAIFTSGSQLLCKPHLRFGLHAAEATGGLTSLKDGKCPLEPICGSSRDIPTLQALLLHICHLGQVFLSLSQSSKIKYKSDQQPCIHRAQKSQPEAILLILFTCPLTKAEVISCQLRGALTFPLLSLQGRAAVTRPINSK